MIMITLKILLSFYFLLLNYDYDYIENFVIILLFNLKKDKFLDSYEYYIYLCFKIMSIYGF